MVEAIKTMLARTWELVAERIANFLPNLVAGFLVLAFGFLLARLIRGVAARFFVAVRLDRLAERFGIGEILARGDIRHTLAEILATVIYWLVLLASFEVLGDVLGLEGMANFFGQILAYIPRIVVALIIIGVGLLVSAVFGGAVKVAASNAGFPGANLLSQMVKFLISFFAFVMALQQLAIPTQLLVGTLFIVMAATALGLALAFGLGGRALAEQALRDWMARSRRPVVAEEKNPAAEQDSQ